jgi:hypothetical protein
MPFNGRQELRPAEADERPQRLFDARRMAELAQKLCEHPVALIFAVQEHAVEVENDRVEVAHQSSNSAVPTRTAVAPSMTACA